MLHHTGDVWQAIHNAQLPLAEDGLLLLAVYADEFYDEKDNIIKMKDFYRKASMKQQEHLDIGVGIWSVETTIQNVDFPSKWDACGHSEWTGVFLIPVFILQTP